MWILDTDSDMLEGKRKWIRPGGFAIIGRTNFSSPTQKAISRRHIVLNVDEIPKGEGLSIRYRSKLTLKEESKKGSTVDGEFISKTSIVLDPYTPHQFLMATAPQVFRINYEPQVFTIHTSGKKKSGDPRLILKDYLSKLEHLDIKCIPEFLPNTTTVVVVPKRNLPISLRGLINGSWVVTPAFVDAVAEAALQVTNDNGELGESKLQEDISAAWPDQLQFLPSPGLEPNPKPPEFFKPNPARKTMFFKWVVLCCTQQHMDIFTGVVTDGGGKTDLFNLEEGKTKPAELIVHMERFQKVIVIHPNVDGEWYIRFRREVEERTGIRFAEQNEFLDAVLMADAKVLARPYEEDSVVVHESLELPAPPPSTEVPKESQPVTKRTRAHNHDHDHEPSKPEPSQMPAPPKTATSSIRTQTRSSRYISQIKIDSDDEDFVPLPPPSNTGSKIGGASQSFKSATAASSAPRTVSFSQLPGRNTQLSAVSESQTQGQTQRTSQRQSQSQLKRAVVSDDEDDDTVMDRMLTGQATLKRRKIEEEAKAKLPSSSKPSKQLPSVQKKAPSPTPPPPEPIKAEEEASEPESKPTTRGKKTAVPSKLIQTAQEIRRKEEARVAEEDAANEMSPEEVAAVSKMRDLAIVEIFEVVTRSDRIQNRSQAYGDEGARWDVTWNGRKNFKKFKKRSKNGEVEGPMRRMGGHIMVPLVEHKSKDYGIGEEYREEQPVRKESEANISHVSETQVGRSSGRKGVMEVIDISDDDFLEEETARDESLAQKRSQGRSQAKSQPKPQPPPATRGGMRQTSTKRTTSNRNSISEEPAKKKAKTKTSAIFLNVESEDEDSDDDELKFKFR